MADIKMRIMFSVEKDGRTYHSKEANSFTMAMIHYYYEELRSKGLTPTAYDVCWPVILYLFDHYTNFKAVLNSLDNDRKWNLSKTLWHYYTFNLDSHLTNILSN